MNRFYHEKQHTFPKLIASILLFVVIFAVFSFGITNVSRETSEKQSESLELAISRGVAHCYASEGFYPENLDYLIENYGITYDTDKYFVDYNVLGENMFPDITIIEK